MVGERRRRGRTYTEDGDVNMATTNHSKGLGGVKARSSRNKRHRLLACVDNIAGITCVSGFGAHLTRKPDLRINLVLRRVRSHA